ncbi:MAG: methyltransferase domain-containing protein [Puniceicoccaceae bacterium]|nr:MAG: methyltransferase domain-containing protein [Puniceicoccaceae bacterium]
MGLSATIQTWVRRNARQRFRMIRPWLVGRTLLDVGAAEGWVGWAAREETGMEVRLVDVADLNRTGLPHDRYDGLSLPYPDNSYDTVLVLLTLHHCDEPERVLAEAARVARRRLLVTESVYRTAPGRLLLRLLDGGFNGLRAAGSMAPARHFKTVAEWRTVFRRHGLRIEAERWLSRGLHWQRLFVLEEERPTRPKE